MLNILSITGSRPASLGLDYGYNSPKYNKIYSLIKEKLIELNPEKIIYGMALGVDTYAVQVAIELGIPFLAAVPFNGQDCKWPPQAQQYYKQLLDKADEVVIVSPGSYSAQKMLIRNEWIVNNSTSLLAVWDGKSSGTEYCINYATSRYKHYKIHLINPNV